MQYQAKHSRLNNAAIPFHKKLHFTSKKRHMSGGNKNKVTTSSKTVENVSKFF